MKKTSCTTCKSFLVAPRRTGENYDLVTIKDRSGLHYASDTVEMLCQSGESVLRKYKGDRKLMDANLVPEMTKEAKKHLPFAPFADNPDCDDHGDHLDVLSDRILREFFNIRLFHVAKS
jgi:hypothetical protein